MASNSEGKDDAGISSSNELYPAVNKYQPKCLRDLKKGDKKLWCTCGLSRKQPWCDGSHKGTGFKPMKWKVPESQTLYQICACKYTKAPPFCDGTHSMLPIEVMERQKACSKREACHKDSMKLCTGCGWVPDF